MLDENGKPFWMKFFKADYLNESQDATKDLVSEVKKTFSEKERKLQIEYEKVRKLEARLAKATKL